MYKVQYLREYYDYERIGYFKDKESLYSNFSRTLNNIMSLQNLTKQELFDNIVAYINEYARVIKIEEIKEGVK